MKYFGRNGKPIPEAEWERLKSDKCYWELAETIIRGTLIRTTWVGKGEEYSYGKPLILRTVVYRYPMAAPEGPHEITWHTTEHEAWCCHSWAVEKVCESKAHAAIENEWRPDPWTHN